MERVDNSLESFHTRIHRRRRFIPDGIMRTFSFGRSVVPRWTMTRRYRKASRFEFRDHKTSIIGVISLRSDDTRGRTRSVSNEFPRGCNNGIFTMFDRRNKSSKQYSIPDGNNGNPRRGWKKNSVVALSPSRSFSVPRCI